MNFLIEAIRNMTGFSQLCTSLKNTQRPVLATGLCDSLYALFSAATALEVGKNTVVIMSDEKAAKAFATEISALIPADYYPARDLEFAASEASSRDFSHERLAVLSKVASGNAGMIVTTVEAACQRTIPKKLLLSSMKTISVGDTLDPAELSEYITSLGYSRADKVEGAGQFSVRGGIIDIFVPVSQEPVRIEFFGDEIDSIAPFDLLTQRRGEPLKSTLIAPSDEIFISAQNRELIAQKLASELKKATKNEEKRNFLAAELDRAEGGLPLAGDLYIDMLCRRESLLEYTPDYLFIAIDQDDLRGRLEASRSLCLEQIKALFEQNRSALPPKEMDPICDFREFCELLQNRPVLLAESFSAGRSPIEPAGIYNFKTRSAPSLPPEIELLSDALREYLDSRFTINILCGNSLEAANLFESLSERQLPVAIAENNDDIVGGVSAVYITSAIKGEVRSFVPSGGFELIDSRFVLLTPAGNAGHAPARRMRPKKQTNREKIISYSDLKTGDYVVHAVYGIGLYRGIEKIGRDGTFKDFIKIQYAGSDVLYVPCSNLDNVSKYIGSKSDSPDLKLSRMGGGEWQKQKTRAKAAAKEIARELIALYADRMNRRGYAFSPDTEWQSEFESGFEYTETDGQLRACEEIKSDMEKPFPMDRLLCGDVGFGKTEVALRGVFKCIMDNKQAAILVPTTILAWQHFQTALARFCNYPVRIEMLSRFRTKKEQTAIIKKLKSGEIDIIIGTHRLLQSDIAFRDLGFLVIDEEQRFGVSHKEKLKMLARDVDVLTLTATPIPRTLSMAIGGIRDMSVLEEAPEDRFPVQTYVFPFESRLVLEAVRKELGRGGQVFYLVNNIEKLPAKAAMIRNEFPEAVVETAHGRLEKDELSEVWRNMMEGRTDVLVCTTIIETGIDLPNANTLIIEDADHFGLSQLHQIRGRVGRSDRKAYAYLTYRPGKVLSEISVKRLKAIREYTEFGSGFKLALRDLEIRGAGNLLGAAQHGHMDSVGYDLYMKILSDAVMEERGTPPAPEKPECFIDLPVNAFIPDDYIESAEMRIDIYKKIAAIENDSDVADLTDELIDRFGEIPTAVENLFEISIIKHTAELCSVTRIRLAEERLIFTLSEPDAIAVSLLAELYRRDFAFSLTAKPYFSLKAQKADSLCSARQLCEHYLGFINENKKGSENEN